MRILSWCRANAVLSISLLAALITACIVPPDRDYAGYYDIKTLVCLFSVLAVVGALYTVMSLMSSVFGLTYGPIQCRFSEALTVLPFFLPEAVPGLFVGCLVTNLMSTVGPLDIVIGSMATLLAALWTAKMPNKWLAPLPPVICNAVLIGAMIAWYLTGFSAQFPALFAYNAVTVGIGEAVACYVLGLLLLTILPRIPALRGRLTLRA